jgi:hypothetical protein
MAELNLGDLADVFESFGDETLIVLERKDGTEVPLSHVVMFRLSRERNQPAVIVLKED